MNENLKAFLEKISEDDELKAKVSAIAAAAAESVGDVKTKFTKLGEEYGYSFTEEDLNPPSVNKQQLNEEELNAVAGGKYVKGTGGKLISDCYCYGGGGGDSDKYQKHCTCVLAGAGELTKLGKEKANSGEIGWTGNKGAKVAMFCPALGSAW